MTIGCLAEFRYFQGFSLVCWFSTQWCYRISWGLAFLNRKKALGLTPNEKKLNFLHNTSSFEIEPLKFGTIEY